MQAYKLKGQIDEFGHLIITEPINLKPGDVEIIILQEVENGADSSNNEPLDTTPQRQVPTKIKALRNWFAKTQPAPPDFDADEARWEGLKEKHNL